MLRHSLYKKFSNGGTNPYDQFKIDPILLNDQGYTTSDAPEGTISTKNNSYAPGSFKGNPNVPVYTPMPSPLNLFDVNLNQPGVQQGPLTTDQLDERQMAYDVPTDNNSKEIPYGDYFTLGLLGADAIFSNIQNKQNNQQFTESVQQRNSKPLYDYNYMYGRTTSGGTEYQPVIKAEMGAQINKRTNTPYAPNNVEVEGGEFIQLPTLDTELAVGPSHANGGVSTILPNNTRVYSDKLKPEGSKKTFAQLAKKYDVDPYKKVLENTFAKQVDRDTATLMMQRNQKQLDELFAVQQSMNGNSNGQPKAAEGSFTFDPTKPPIPAYTAEEIKNLKAMDPNLNPSSLEVPGVQKNLGTGVYGDPSNLDLFKTNWDWYIKDLESQGLAFDPSKQGEMAKAQRAFNEEATNRYIRSGLTREQAAARVQQEGFVTDPNLQNSIDDMLGLYTATRVLPKAAGPLTQVENKPELPLLDETPVDETTAQTASKFNPAAGINNKGTYTPGNFPLYQAIPEAMGLAKSQETYPYALPELDAPYIRPQTLNIQSQIQDIDSMTQSAVKAGADPYNTYIAGLDAKQRAFQTKQNYDAQMRGQADQFNAQAKLNADQVNLNAFNQVYNNLRGQASDAKSAEQQRAIASLVNKKGKFNQEEALKKAYIENLVTNFDVDSSGKISLTPDQLQQFFYNMPTKTPIKAAETTKTTKSTNSTKTTKTKK